MEFLENLEWELRTPLNSILILAQLLAENPDGNLTAKQVEFARVIHREGIDLYHLPRTSGACRRRSSPAASCHS